MRCDMDYVCQGQSWSPVPPGEVSCTQFPPGDAFWRDPTQYSPLNVNAVDLRVVAAQDLPLCDEDLRNANFRRTGLMWSGRPELITQVLRRSGVVM
jgi:hypothetical protein